MRLDKYVATLPDGAASLFDSEKEYPAPFDELGVKIAQKAMRDFGGLKIMPYVEDLSLADLQELIHDELLLNSYQIDALNKIMASLEVDSDTPDKIEVRTYGEAVNTDEYGQTQITSNIGARSSTDTLGATNGTTTESDTSYETTTGRLTKSVNSTTNIVTNGTSSQAAIDSTTSAAHTDTKRKYEHADTIEHFNNVGEDDAPDYVAKWMAMQGAPVLATFEKMIVDALAMPYYEEV